MFEYMILITILFILTFFMIMKKPKTLNQFTCSYTNICIFILYKTTYDIRTKKKIKLSINHSKKKQKQAYLSEFWFFESSISISIPWQDLFSTKQLIASNVALLTKASVSYNKHGNFAAKSLETLCCWI